MFIVLAHRISVSRRTGVLGFGYHRPRMAAQLTGGGGLLGIIFSAVLQNLSVCLSRVPEVSPTLIHILQTTARGGQMTPSIDQ